MVSVTPHVRVIPTREDNAFSMEPALLEAAIKEDLAAGARTCRQHACSSGSLASSCMSAECPACVCRLPTCLQSAPLLSAECLHGRRVPACLQCAQPLSYAAWLKAAVGEVETKLQTLHKAL